MIEFFSFEERPRGGWLLKVDLDKFTKGSISGSANVIACRLFGIDWPHWLRICRGAGAQLMGRNTNWVLAVWKEPNKEFVRKLNVRANELSKLIDFKELRY